MSKQPNILFIIADDHRFDAIRAMGDPTVQTPPLDSLVEQGVSFRQNHMMGGLTGAVCVPSRACIHTGANTFRAASSRDTSNYQGLMTIPPPLSLLPETFRQAGYQTFATGKWHNDKASFAKSFAAGDKIFFGGMSDHLQVPVHDYDPAGIYPDEARYMGEAFSSDLFSDAAIQFLTEYEAQHPFFLYLAFTAPHDPRMAPSPYADMYDPADIPLPENFLAEHPFDNGDLRLRDEQLAPWPRTPEIVRRHMADYYAMISHMDFHIGRVLAALQASGHAENTIVIYTADDRLAVGQHGLLGKQNMYDHSVRIPLLIKGPGLPAGQAINTLTYTYDLFPTLCDLADIPTPDSVESHSLLPQIRGGTEPVRGTVYTVYKDIQRMVSDGQWKLIRYYYSEKDQVGENRIQLFHLADDPWELHDLSTEPSQQDQIRRLAEALAAWQEQVDDPLRDQPIIPGQV